MTNQTYYKIDYWCEEDGEVKIDIQEFRVIKTTPKGCWVVSKSYNSSKKHFILNDSRKKYAYPTKAEARTGFIAKKRREIAICQWRVDCAKEATKLAESMTL